MQDVKELAHMIHQIVHDELADLVAHNNEKMMKEAVLENQETQQMFDDIEQFENEIAPIKAKIAVSEPKTKTALLRKEYEQSIQLPNKILLPRKAKQAQPKNVIKLTPKEKEQAHDEFKSEKTPKEIALEIAKEFKRLAVAQNPKVVKLVKRNGDVVYISDRDLFYSGLTKNIELMKELKALGFIVGAMEGRFLTLPMPKK